MASPHSRIPEHVRRQAMDAVAHRETTAMIRAYGHANVPPEQLFASRPVAPAEPRPLSDDVKRQALDAVRHRETTAQIRLVRDTGSVTPPLTPMRDTALLAERTNRLQREALERTQPPREIGRDHD